jgi:hypothetical protein
VKPAWMSVSRRRSLILPRNPVAEAVSEPRWR